MPIEQSAPGNTVVPKQADCDGSCRLIAAMMVGGARPPGHQHPGANVQQAHSKGKGATATRDIPNDDKPGLLRIAIWALLHRRPQQALAHLCRSRHSRRPPGSGLALPPGQHLREQGRRRSTSALCPQSAAGAGMRNS